MMIIRTRYIGNSIIELTTYIQGNIITEDVTDLNGMVDVSLIENLRDIADELEEHNKNTSK